MNSNLFPPIIIIGMHRSGTSMISRMLEELGLFMGVKKQIDYEALFFLNMNDWLLRQCGSSWDNPKPFQYFLEHKEARSLAEKYINYIMSTPRVANFLGWKKYMRYHSLGNVPIPWGWKDPRNTFTLPLWLDIFPDAKIIHIYRNGIDVANSLNVRDKNGTFPNNSHAINGKRRFLYVLRPKKGGFYHSLRCTSLAGAFSLWEEYLNEAKKHIAITKDRSLEIKYEDFIAEPHAVLTSLVRFCGLTVSADDISKTLKQVKKSRAYAYKDKPELLEFSKQVTTRLRIYGY
jgi:hypothetical protein